MWKKILKTVLFVTIFCIILDVVNGILVPKTKTVTSNLRGFYELPEEEIDVLFVGNSKVHSAISPMQIYDDYGITSYVLSSDGQPFELAYTLISEAIKTQDIKLVVLEMTGLMTSWPGYDAWQTAMNELPLSINKLEAVSKYIRLGGTEPLALLLPVYAYNNRWQELTNSDFNANLYVNEYYTNGFNFHTMRIGTDYTIDQMNQDAMKYEIDVDFLSEKKEELKNIKQLCHDNGAELLAISLPALKSSYAPGVGWTTERSRLTKEICSLLEIEYVDLMYDGNIKINWYTETIDKGYHLNYSGAKKVSELIGRYIYENYSNVVVPHTSAKFEKDLEIYLEVSKVAELQVETNFATYLDKVRELDDAVIIIVTGGVTEEGVFNDAIHQKLHEMGIRYDTANVQNLSNIFLFNAGDLKIIKQDEKTITYSYTLGGTDILLQSSVAEERCSIQINNQKVNYKDAGVNIVVLDEASGIVLDSASFIYNGYPHAYRDYGFVLQTMKQYQSYIQN